MGEQQYFTLDQLAAAAGMTARNVRAYQTRQLLPPPVRDGRSAVYDTDHLHRLIQVRRLREAGVPLRMIQQAVARGEDLGDGGPLHSWAAPADRAAGGTGGTAEEDGTDLRPVDPQVLELAERAVPGIREALGELHLLAEDGPGARAAGAVVELLVRMPSIATTHPHVLDVVRAAGRMSESLRSAITSHTAHGSLGQELGELAHVAAVVVRACLTGRTLPDAQIDLRDSTGSALQDGSGA